MQLRPLTLILAAMCLFAAGYLVAEETRSPDDPTSIASKITTIGAAPNDASDIAEKAASRVRDTADPARQKEIQEQAARDIATYMHARHMEDANLIRRAATDPHVASELGVEAMYAYTSKIRNASTASQATQLSGEMSLRLQGVQIAQNAHIIELLEKIASEKK